MSVSAPVRELILQRLRAAETGIGTSLTRRKSNARHRMSHSGNRDSEAG